MRGVVAAGLGLFAAGIVVACAATQDPPPAHSMGSGGAENPDAATSDADVSTDADADADEDASLIDFDVMSDAPSVDKDAACAAVTQEAVAKPLPVDIIWMVDNSVSMAPAVAEVQAGLNGFASAIAASSLDYKVILLSLKNAMTPITYNGNKKYPVCVPAPLAGDDACGNGPRFFHANLDVLSIQTLEQFLGTLGQTTGYTAIDPRGSEPWAGELRSDATKTIVVVTDDNARLSATDFETYPGGTNPYNSLLLPPGILDPHWGGAFDGFLFSAIYGWGSDNDPGAKCTYPDQSVPPSPGITYTALVNQTGGVRAKVCDGHAAWQPFLDKVAQAVVKTSKISCSMDIPAPDAGSLDPAKVNVQLTADGNSSTLAKVADAASCGADGGWYYDDDAMPTKVILCPASCSTAQNAVGVDKSGKIEILFGCATILK